MGDEYHRARVLVERFRDDRQMAEVDVVCRLVENKEPRALEHERSEGDEALLPFGEAADLRMQISPVMRNPAAIVRSVSSSGFPIAWRARRDGLVEIERGEILAVIADLCSRR